MKTKLKFVAPRVTQMVEFQPEMDILGRSTAEMTMFITAGQEVETHTFTESKAGVDDGYSYYWE